MPDEAEFCHFMGDAPVSMNHWPDCLARPRWPRSPTGGTCSRGAISGRAARASPHRLESTFSSSTGRRYAPSGPRPAPRLACHPARAAPSQATRCEAGIISLAWLGQAGPTNPQPPWQPQAGTAPRRCYTSHYDLFIPAV